MDEELRQAIESVKEQQPVQVNLDWYQDTIKLPEIKEFIRANINSASRSFVAIGYYLKYVRDRQLYKEEGYTGVSDFAKAEFGISAAQASKFISINDRFSMAGNSPVLLEQYRDFTSSKLSEMLYLTDEQLEQVSITTTRAEIRDIVNPDRFSHAKTEPKCFIRDQINETHEEDLKCSGGISDDCNTCDKTELIDNLDFSVNTYNCLKRANIDTIEQLCNLTENKVIAIRNISRKCLDEIKLKLSEIGRGLKPDDITETVNNDPEIVDNEPEIVNDVDETVIETSESVIEEQESVIETVEADIIQTVSEENPSDARLTPMKMKHSGDCYTCPTCGAVMIAEYYTKQIYWKFCAYCGQALILTNAKTSNPDRPEPIILNNNQLVMPNKLVDFINSSGTAQYSQIKKVVTDVCSRESADISNELIDRITNNISIWLLDIGNGYEKYLKDLQKKGA